MATDNLTILDTNYVNVTGIKVRGTGNGMLTYVRPQGTKTITENGTDIDVTEYASIDVDVDNAVDGSAYQDEDGFIVLGDGESLAPQGTITITENGTTNVSSYAAAQVNVTPNLQSKTIILTPSQQIISADEGYDGLSQVTINPVSSPKDVTFRDYDGTLVATYTKEEFVELTEMPSNPSHEKLIAQGWNWSLAEAQAYVAKYGQLEIGQMYETASGKTEIDVTFDDPKLLSPYLAVGIVGKKTITIDWGDDSATQTITGTSRLPMSKVYYLQHTYASIGTYTISIDGPVSFYTEINLNDYNTNKSNAILRDTAGINGRRVYAKCIKNIRIGTSANIDSYAFYCCYDLTTVSIPNTIITSIEEGAFRGCINLQSICIPDSVNSISKSVFLNCSGLRSISIPNSVTSIGDGAISECYSLTNIFIPDNVILNYGTFASCPSLTKIIIPDSITNIGDATFSDCYGLTSVLIPNSITIIGSYAFSDCYSVLEYHLLPTTPPTLIHINAFYRIVSGTKIYVPAASLEAYKTATNWSTYANYMEGE